MDRRHRLNRPQDVRRVRSSGRSFADPHAVLVTRRNDLERSRFAVGAGRGLGGAVRRNRAKRRLRSALHSLTPRIAPGWDLVLLAREPAATAGWPELLEAVSGLCRRAGVLSESA